MVYPHQLKVSEKSELKVNVIHSYFRGNHYLIEAMYENQSVFFENVMDIEMGKELYLEIIKI